MTSIYIYIYIWRICNIDIMEITELEWRESQFLAQEDGVALDVDRTTELHLWRIVVWSCSLPWRLMAFLCISWCVFSYWCLWHSMTVYVSYESYVSYISWIIMNYHEIKIWILQFQDGSTLHKSLEAAPNPHLCYRTWSLMETVDAKLVWPHKAGNAGTLEVAGNTLEVTGSWTSRPRAKNREDAAEVDLVVPQPTSRLNGCDNWRKLASEIPTAWRNAAWIPWYQPSKVTTWTILNCSELLKACLDFNIFQRHSNLQKKPMSSTCTSFLVRRDSTDPTDPRSIEVPHTESVPPKLVAEKMDTLPPMLTSNH